MLINPDRKQWLRAHLSPFLTGKLERVDCNLSAFTWKQWRVSIQHWAGFWFAFSLWCIKWNDLVKRNISAKPDSDMQQCIEFRSTCQIKWKSKQLFESHSSHEKNHTLPSFYCGKHTFWKNCPYNEIQRGPMLFNIVRQNFGMACVWVNDDQVFIPLGIVCEAGLLLLTETKIHIC